MNPTRVFQAKVQNLLATAILLASLCAILGLMGFMVFGAAGSLAAILGGVIAFVLFPLASNDLVMRMMRGQRLSYVQAPWLFEMVHNLARKANLPKPPELFIVPRAEANALAIGSRRKPAIGIFQGLLNQMNRDELEGVLAHELMHICNNDTTLMNLSNLMHRLTQNIALLGFILVLMSLPMYLLGVAHPPILAMLLLFALPIASQLLLLAISRTREFNADLGAVALTNNPHGLASALNKLEHQRKSLFRHFFPGRNLQTPPSWLTTHPPTKERIARIFEAAQRKEAEAETPYDHTPRPNPTRRVVRLYHPKRFNPRALY